MSNEQQLPTELSIHGFRFVIDRRQSKAIRIFWAVAIFCSIGGMAFYARGIFIKWVEPTIVQVTQLKNIREIPLPAVTICSPLLAKSDFVDFGKFFGTQSSNESLDKISTSQQIKLSALSKACFSRKLHDENLNFRENKMETVKYLEEASQKVSDAITSLKTFHDYQLNASNYFNPVLTDHGICYNFNMLGYHSIFNNQTLSTDFNSYIRKGIKIGHKLLDDENEEVEWKITTGYLTKDPQAFPHRIKKGFNDNLKIKLFINKSDTINLCPRLRNSYKVILHQPNEMPTEFHDNFFVGLKVNHIISMTASVYASDLTLHSYSPEKRGCYLENEKKLEFFKSYTKLQCVMECFANFTLKTCGCKKFSMPRSQDTPICGLNDTKCLMKVIPLWTQSEEFGQGSEVLCDCLPACDHIDYGIQMINHVDYDENVENREIDIETQIETIFEKYLIEQHTATVVYKLANFVADLGGLLGLFMGCSLLSLVELIYFCVRGCIRQRKEDQKKETIRIRQNLRNEEFLRTLRMIREDGETGPTTLYLP